MIKKTFVSLIIPVIIVSAGFGATSFTNDNVGTTGGIFLKMSKGVRAIGMGEAYAGVSDRVDAIFWNPAGLNSLKGMEIAAMHTVWFENIYYNYIIAAYPTKVGVFGLSLNYLGMDDIDMYYNNGAAADSTYSPYDMIAIISYADKIEGTHNFGLNFKYIRSDIDGDIAQAFAADIGYMNDMIENELVFGVVVQNIGTEMKFNNMGAPLPVNLKVGSSYIGLAEGLILALDVNFPIDNNPSVHFGTEYTYAVNEFSFIGRTGYKTTSIRDLEPLAGLSAGAGITYSGIAVDYAWVPYGDLGNTHRFSLSYRFPGRWYVKKRKKQPVRAIDKLFRRKPEPEPENEKRLSEEEKLELKREYFMKGHSSFTEKKYKKSIAWFNKVLDIDPAHYESMKYIGRIRESMEEEK